MLFNSIEFFVFFAVILVLYYSTLKTLKLQNLLLLVAGYFFYGWWDWRFVFLLCLSTCIDFFFGLLIYNSVNKKKFYLVLSIFNNLIILCFFKYYNFFADSAQYFLNSMGFEAHPYILNIVLPIGISFYTFHGMSYVIDIYRGNTVPTKNFVDYSVFVCFFPLLVAGPIERATHLLPQIEKPRSMNSERIYEGLVLMLIGMFRKVVIADNISTYVDAAFSSAGTHSSVGLVIGVLLFAVQIYCDFAGYSDIARGVAKIMGFELLVNFRQPYFSANITEFWRRWHISLSSWLRDYLYISLGGNRKGKVRTYVNLIITMFLGGLWHGASWMFIIWGFLHGIYLAVHKWWLDRIGVRVKGDVANKFTLKFFIGMMFTNFLVAFAWIFFRAGSMEQAISVISGIASFRSAAISGAVAAPILLPLVALIVSTISIILIDIPQYKANNDNAFTKLHWGWQSLSYTCMLIALMLFVNDGEASFIYFQF